jgi:hypothetical protein
MPVVTNCRISSAVRKVCMVWCDGDDGGIAPPCIVSDLQRFEILAVFPEEESSDLNCG